MPRAFAINAGTLIAALLLTATATAELRLPALLADHMVLQQGQPARLWGWCASGETVTVRVSWESQQHRTRADQKGRWQIDIPTPTSQGPHEISFTAAGKTVTLRDVLIGEVWVCSGQSNMEWPVKWTDAFVNGALDPVVAQQADAPEVRLFTVPRAAALEPQDDCEGKWQRCSPETVVDFSATAFFFGRALHAELGTPIGLIHSSWGGTRAEVWTSRAALQKLGGYEADLAREHLPNTPENRAAQAQSQRELRAKAEQLCTDDSKTAAGYANLDFNDAAWEQMDLPRLWESLGAQWQIDGAVWFRKAIEIPPSWAGKELKLSLARIDDCDLTYFNGQRVGALGFSYRESWQQPRRYIVPGKLVRPGRAVLAVRVFDNMGGGGFSGSPDEMYLAPTVAVKEGPARLSLAGPWKYKLEQLFGSDAPPIVGMHTPAALQNAMIHPLLPYRIRGVIWYQGESNHTAGQEYGRLFPAMIADWREQWSLGDFPFYFVQIAPYHYGEQDAAAFLREAQLKTLAAAPNTGMIVTTDIATPDDIHPRNKRDVGARLARWALAKTYDRNGLTHTGPLYERMTVEGDTARITFAPCGGDPADCRLVARGGKLREFEIAGSDQVFYPAEARISGDAVLVRSQHVARPAVVRFGWSNAPMPNLFNGAGLPASPFRTDDWNDATRADSPSLAGQTSDERFDVTVQVHTDQPLVDDFHGFGVQWSSYPWWDVSDADWEKIYSRLDFMQMPITRVMIDAWWYCRGFDETGKPIYDWDTSYMQKLYRLLDWCERNNCRVMFGEWGRPNGSDLSLAADDPRWTHIVADCVEHLLNTKGYTCIRWYNLINEPHGWWTGVTFEEWYRAITNLQKEFAARGLLERLTIAAPDADQMFTTRCLKYPELRALTGIYDEHWYVVDEQIKQGSLELMTREQRRQIDQFDPGKPYVLGELGLLDGKTEHDQQPNVHKFWYAVAMADAAIQIARGGSHGMIAWNLDDAMHYWRDGGETMNALGDTLPDKAYEHRKVWGMWNILGSELGNDPADEHLRPWFFTWGLLSRAFPQGAQTLETDPTGIYELRVLGARFDQDGQPGYSIALVNRQTYHRRVRVRFSEAQELVTLHEYRCFDADKDDKVDGWPVVDGQGRDVFPAPAAVRSNVDLSDGCVVTLPGPGVVVLTTIGDGQSVIRQTQRMRR